MKLFLTYSALIEALTGVLLITFPSRIVYLLLETTLNGPGEFIVTMIAGAAIFSLAAGCWFLRETAAAPIGVKVLFIYNAALTVIVLYAILGYALKDAALWLVGGFHLFQTLVSLRILQIKKAK